MRLEVVKRKTKEHFLMEGFQNSIIPEINIYNQAHLELERPLVKASRIHKKTNHEIGVSFSIDGELTGKAVCLVDLYEKKLHSDQIDQLHSLFAESMNILLGRILTVFEEETDLMCMLGQPHQIGRSQTFENYGQASDLKMSLGYKLITSIESYDCRIYILANKVNVKEV
ncbi:MAG: hypothetical protein KC478_14620 [Bacteriovoracaceae bacterium]|nr:hypothetical protein [Bacteriovoracaceae bacterium]